MSSQTMDDRYDHLPYGRSELRKIMAQYYDKIIDFVTAPSFKALLLDLYALPNADRPTFVHKVLLDDAELRKRGIVVPDGILIQRSAFGDRRPTLFAVKHFLPDAYAGVWENVNITFDNAFSSDRVSRERADCWRAPLEPAFQAQAMCDNQDLRVA